MVRRTRWAGAGLQVRHTNRFSCFASRVTSSRLGLDDRVCDWRPQTNGAMALMMD